MPHITTNLINHLLRDYIASSLQLGAIKSGNRRSHPVIFGRPLYHALHQLRGDIGARELFQKYHNKACLVEPEEDYDDMDIDTLEDYLTLKRSMVNISAEKVTSQ